MYVPGWDYFYFRRPHTTRVARAFPSFIITASSAQETARDLSETPPGHDRGRVSCFRWKSAFHAAPWPVRTSVPLFWTLKTVRTQHNRNATNTSPNTRHCPGRPEGNGLLGTDFAPRVGRNSPPATARTFEKRKSQK